MDSRRHFLGKVASGLGSLAAVPRSVLGANERIRVGFIGFGDRATELLNHVRACPGAEVAAVSDIYTRQLERAASLAPGIKVYREHNYILDDRSIDAVVIATPLHLHAGHFCAALDAGKHVYQEKTMAFTMEHARRMRTAFVNDAGKHTVQIGHQCCSSGHAADVRQFLSDPRRMGKITAIHMRMYRNTPQGKAPWSRTARITADMNPENVAWNSFLGEAPGREFDPQRYMNWRLYSDYSGGNVYESMTHQLCFWYKSLSLKIPSAATMNGGVYLWKDGREVPDTMSVTLEQPEEILISWTSGFGNSQPGIAEDILGENGALLRANQVRYVPQKITRPDGNEMTGHAASVPHAHMQNFLDAIRGATEINCPFDLGYRVSVAARMAVESYRLGRTVRWDAKKEEIV
jgi:predicted dehydrogenase